jgi:hypothetical protein
VVAEEEADDSSQPLLPVPWQGLGLGPTGHRGNHRPYWRGSCCCGRCIHPVRHGASVSSRSGCTHALMERRWQPGWLQARGPMLWVPGEPRCDFMCSAERKSLRTPVCRQGRQAKRNAIVGGGGDGEDEKMSVLM